MMDSAKPLFYEFDEFRLDTERRLLLRNGEQISLTPKVFDTLLVFLENRGEVLDKDRLMQELWSDSFVEESNIAQNVAVLRKALGEKSKENKFIVTIPGRGYRFVADVICINGDTAPANGRPKNSEKNYVPTGGNVLTLVRPTDGRSAVALMAEEPEKEEKTDPVVSIPDVAGTDKDRPGLSVPPALVSGRSRRFPRYFAAAVVGLLVVMALGAYVYFTRTAPGTVRDTATIAVLPLQPVSPENRDFIVEFAIAESLIFKLSAVPNLTVRPLSAVRKYVELDRDPIDAGKELNADYVLSSNYQLLNGRIRVTSQLLNVRTEQTEDRFKSESDVTDAFSMQDAVANEIGNAMLARFGHKQSEYMAKRGTESEEAYRLYFQGQYLVDKKTREDAERAIEIFDETLKLDPKYAHAWAGKAAAHCTFAHFGGIEPKLAFTTAKPALEKAFELDPNLAEAHAVRGIISFDYDWQFEKGLEHFRKALELNPHHEMARRWYANRLALMGRYDEALTEIKTLIDINPNGIFQQWDLANILYQSRRYDEAIVQLHRVFEMDRNMAWPANLIWVSYHMKGNHEQAYAWFVKLQEKRKTDPAEIEVYKKTYEISGWSGVLAKHSEILRSRYKSDEYDPSSSSNLLMATLVGDKEAAFKFAGNAVKFRDLWVPHLLNDPAYDVLRDDPRFADLKRRMGA